MRWQARERGVALILALLVVILLAGMTVAMLDGANALLRASQQHSSAVQADQIAEAGIDHARRVLQLGAMDGWSDELAAGLGLVDVPYSQGTYTVDLNATPDANLIVVNCTATLPGPLGGTLQRSIQAAVLRSPVMAGGMFALITGKDLSITGNPTIAGTMGSVHANGNIDVAGKPTVSKDVTTSGTFTKATPTVGGVAQSGVAKQPIESVDVTKYKAKAQYIMNANGTVTTVATGMTAALPKAGFLGWTWKAATGWNYGGNGAAADKGIFYFEGDVTVAGNPGNKGAPWQVTILSTGSVNISGNPTMYPADTVDKLMIVAQKDVELSGNVNEGDLKAFLEQPAIKIAENPPPQTVYLTFSGVIMAHEQAWLNGNPVFFGKIIVEDAVDTARSLTNKVLISGNPTILYNGDGAPPPISMYEVPVKSWVKLLSTEMTVVQNAGSLTLHSYDAAGTPLK